MVPNEWKQTTLDKVLTIGGGKDYKHLDEGSIPVYGSGGYMLSVSDYLYDGDSVCIGRKGTIDKPMFLRGKFWTVDTLFYTHSFRNSEPYYIYQFFQTVPWRRLNEASGVPSLSKSIINKVKINLPPLPEQRKIAKILSTWDKAISTTERLIDNSKQQKKALMQQLLTGKKRLFDDSGKPFEGEWKTKRLGEISEIKSAGVDKKIIEGEAPVRLLNFTDVFRRDFIYSNELDHWVTAPDAKVKNCDVRKGDLFFTPSSETRNEIGIPSVAAEDIPECCYSYHIIRCRINEKWDLNFKAYAFSTDEFRRQAYKLGDGSGQRYVISQDGFRGIEVKYPEYEEQIVIGKVLKSSEDTIQVLKLKLDLLKQEKKALMQQLLTGKRRVKVDDKEIA